MAAPDVLLLYCTAHQKQQALPPWSRGHLGRSRQRPPPPPRLMIGRLFLTDIFPVIPLVMPRAIVVTDAVGYCSPGRATEHGRSVCLENRDSGGG